MQFGPYSPQIPKVAWWELLFFFFFIFLIFNFISPNVCHWDMFFWRGATKFTVTETIIFPFLFVNKQLIFLSQWPFSLFVAKTCLSDRIFTQNFFACGGLINFWVTFGNSFFTQKAVWKTPPRNGSVFETVFWVKREFPNVTRKLISPLQATKKIREKYGR